MLYLILGIIIGALCGIVLKDKFIPNPLKQQNETLLSKLDTSERIQADLRNNISKLKQELETCKKEAKNIRNDMKEKEDVADEMSDEMGSLKKRAGALQQENQSLKQELSEMKMLYDARKQELEHLQEAKKVLSERS